LKKVTTYNGSFEALLISEPKIKFTVPIKVTHYTEYLKNQSKVSYGLPVSSTLSKIDGRLKQLREQKKHSL
jgi:hypothetical protein